MNRQRGFTRTCPNVWLSDTAHDLDSWTYYLVGRKAQLSFERDLYDEALAIAEDVLTRDNQTLLMRMPALIIKARAQLRLGHSDAASSLADAVKAAEKIDEPQYVVTVRIAQLEAAVLAQDHSFGAKVLDRVAGLSADKLSPRKRGEFLFWAQVLNLAPHWDAGADLPGGFRHARQAAWDSAAKAFAQEQSIYLQAWAIAQNGAYQAADDLFAQVGAAAARKALRQYGASPLAALRRVSKLRCKNRLEVVLRVQSEGWILGQAATP